MWKKYISSIGIKKVSEGVGCSYEVVRLWANSDLVPSNKNRIKLMQLMQTMLTKEQYYDFKSSLTLALFPEQVEKHRELLQGQTASNLLAFSRFGAEE